MNIPSHLKYTKSHEWIRPEADGSVTVGITDHAQAQLGDLVYVQLPEVRTSFQQGQECTVVESVKAAADVYAPVSGEIIAINEKLADSPESLNGDPYGAWLFRIRPADPAQIEGLLDADGYRAVADEH